MKKLFLMGFVALAFASCVSDKEVTPQTPAQKYKAAFEALVGGQVNPNVNWGFNDQTPLQFDANGNLITGMRGEDKNNNRWGLYVEVPDSINQLIRNKVTKYFTETYKPLGVAVNWSDFFAQQISSTNRGANMNYLYCGNKREHINDFNYGNGGGKRNVGIAPKNDGSQNCFEKDYNDGITFMTNSSTEFFAFHNSYDSKYYEDNYVIIPGEVIDAAYPDMQPSLAGMWFVGFDYEHSKQLDNEHMDIVERDFYFNDWIVRISPGIYKESDRVFAEDLIDSSLDKVDISDWDFNDAVFDVRFVSEWVQDPVTYQSSEKKFAIITLWAAGGTKNLTVAGKEVHELFGKSTGTMINTNANGGVDGVAPVIFRVETDATNAINIPVKVNGTTLEAKQGEATQKMCVAYGTKWMKERKIITGSYTKFQEYVRTNSPLDWYKTVTNESDLCNPPFISTVATKY